MTERARRRPAAEPRGCDPAIGETIIGIGLLVLAGVVFWQTLAIPVSPIYSKVGPTVVPIHHGGRPGRCSASCCCIEALRGGWQPEEEKEVAPDWRRSAGSRPVSCSTSC